MVESAPPQRRGNRLSLGKAVGSEARKVALGAICG